MDVALTVALLTLPTVISVLQTCSLGTETSSTQILLDVSTTQINTGGGMCSCRLTVSQTTQMEMFTASWTSQCDTYMIIQKWRTSTQCRNGVIQTPPPQSHTVTTGEDIWILVVATKPGVRGLSGQLQFEVKQPSGNLTIECFEPNTNSSTTTTPTTTSTTTTTATSVPTTTTVRSMKPASTRPTTSTAQPSSTRTTDSTPQGQTSPGIATGGDMSTSSSAGVTSGSTATPAGSTSPPPAQGAHTDNTKGNFPGGIFAAGVATGAVVVLIAGGLYVVISRRKWWTSRRQKPDDIPISDAHPTYSGFTSRAEEAINTYDKIDPKPSKGVDNPYINVS